MPNTTFRIFVICSGYMQFILSTCIVIMYSRILMITFYALVPTAFYKCVCVLIVEDV